MGKINKYANIYDKEGNLIRKVDKKAGKLKSYTIEELEQLVDKLSEDKDENGKVKDPRALNNASAVLMQQYSTKKGRARLQEMVAELIKNKNNKTTEEQIKDAMENLKKDLENEEAEEDPNEIVSQVETNLDEEYVEFEEVNHETD